ncbi:hypothetical protein CAPN002_00090 [Capnocytophaga stomatis]|uniref:DUF3127 domain-containing protein n=1 Tax=Capnocytophaga stomatis TaxID=1848904 RepID=UPI0019515BEC|nr:DUF3127 domain-containing protein [Capnocytophaga stomatis]GIJ92791.1 hypothetical protein CAPN002_00090 [Capnocytophaga stomatis]
MELQGRIKLIYDTLTFGTNGFQKREVVITTEEQYPQHIIVEFTQEKCALLDAFYIGQLVKISFNVRGREWINPQGEAKYFNSLQGWRIENMETIQQVSQPYGTVYGSYPQNTPQVSPKQTEMFDGFSNPPFPVLKENETQENFDDLPF